MGIATLFGRGGRCATMGYLATTGQTTVSPGCDQDRGITTAGITVQTPTSRVEVVRFCNGTTKQATINGYPEKDERMGNLSNSQSYFVWYEFLYLGNNLADFDFNKQAGKVKGSAPCVGTIVKADAANPLTQTRYWN